MKMVKISTIMKSKILLSSIIFIFTLSCGDSKKAVPQNDDTIVKICTGRYSKRFHDHRCRGLKSCKGEIREITLSEAQERGYTACGYCYKR
jgi:hypothetical protein